MFFFLRNIRRKLISSNKVTTYFLYAVGEIVLVVIGILIAISLNELNQKGKNAKLEIDYLELLVDELESDRKFIERYYLERIDKKLAALHLARDFYQGRVDISDSIAFANSIGYGAVFAGGTFGLQSIVFDEIISTGRLSIIGNPELRRQLIDYHSTKAYIYSSLKEYNSGYIQAVNSLRPFDPENPEMIDAFDLSLLFNKAKTEDFYQLVNAEITYAYQTIRYMRGLESDVTELIKLIDSKLQE